MRPLSRLLFASFCGLRLLSWALSMRCEDSQYAWPMKAPQRCCDMCPPGEHMIRRSRTSCDIECGRCTGERYTDSYNVEMSCNVCVTCDKPNMEYESHCRNAQNAVCRCQVGYECADEACAACWRAPGTVKPLTTDPKWYPVEILSVCVVLVIIVVFLLVLPFLGRIRSKHGFYSVEVKAIRGGVPGNEEEEEMCKPVQEVCDKSKPGC